MRSGRDDLPCDARGSSAVRRCLKVLDDLVEQLSTLVRCGVHDAQAVHGEQVPVDVGLLVEIERAGQVLYVDDVGQGRDRRSANLDCPFLPMQLNTAGSDRTLAGRTPLVFINAFRSAGKLPSYNRLDGWADKFLRAGAAAFVGSLWAVRDTAAREFAEELYGKLQSGGTLGRALMSARRAAAADPGDPTWLAYAVYGDPMAKTSTVGS